MSVTRKSRAVVPSGTGTVNVTVQSGVTETDPNNPNDNVNAPIFGYGTSAVSAADQFTFSSQTVSGTNSSAAFASPTVTAGATDPLTIVVRRQLRQRDQRPGQQRL